MNFLLYERVGLIRPREIFWAFFILEHLNIQKGLILTKSFHFNKAQIRGLCYYKTFLLFKKNTWSKFRKKNKKTYFKTFKVWSFSLNQVYAKYSQILHRNSKSEFPIPSSDAPNPLNFGFSPVFPKFHELESKISNCINLTE